MPNFFGPGTPLSQTGFNAAMGKINAPATAVWSVISVETVGSGYLPDRRPKILFERHIFSRLTGGQYDASHPDISQPNRGGYLGGAREYDRLAEAIALDETSGLQSASWGLGQVLGENYQNAGYPDVQSMVADFVASEDNQFGGMAGFIVSNHLAAALAGKQWTAFADGYNGQAQQGYDTKLANYFARYSASPPPDLDVRAAQTYLNYHGYHVGIDGLNGPQTETAVKAYQADCGLPETGVIDADLLTSLAQP